MVCTENKNSMPSRILTVIWQPEKGKMEEKK